MVIVGLLCYGHNYLILAYQKIFHSYAPLIRLPTSSPGQMKYTPLLLLQVLSSVPANFISTQTDILIAGSLQLYLGTRAAHRNHTNTGLQPFFTGIHTVPLSFFFSSLYAPSSYGWGRITAVVQVVILKFHTEFICKAQFQ